MSLKTNNNTKVRVIHAGKKEDRVIYDWGNGYRLKMDKRGFAVYNGDTLVVDYFEMFSSPTSANPTRDYLS